MRSHCGQGAEHVDLSCCSCRCDERLRVLSHRCQQSRDALRRRQPARTNSVSAPFMSVCIGKAAVKEEEGPGSGGRGGGCLLYTSDAADDM
eukprot:3745250-Rhodomonas_salina.1